MIEIPLLAALPEKDVTFIDMHSVVNTLNVLQLEVIQIEQHLGESDETQALMNLLWELSDALSERERGIEKLATHDGFAMRFLAGMDAIVDSLAKPDPTIEAARKNVQSILAVLQIRAVEYLDRARAPDRWIDLDVERLKNNYRQIFAAIERNAKGAYHIVHNIAQREDGGYLIQFNVTSARDSVIHMPPVFQDVFRDLLANARKYTSPGGEITGGIHQSETELRLVVEDNGCGIPEDEVTEVVKFGQRGSNVRDRRTMGGGFGLTKAVYFTHFFGGRMWIDSRTEFPSGTTVEIRIPLPPGESKTEEIN